MISTKDEPLNIYEQDIGDALLDVLKVIPVLQVIEAIGCARRTAFNWKSAEHRPRRRQLNRLIPLAGRFARDLLEDEGARNIPSDDKQAISRLAQHLRDKEAAVQDQPPGQA